MRIDRLPKSWKPSWTNRPVLFEAGVSVGCRTIMPRLQNKQCKASSSRRHFFGGGASALTLIEAEEREGLEKWVKSEYSAAMGEHGKPDSEDPNPDSELEKVQSEDASLVSNGECIMTCRGELLILPWLPKPSRSDGLAGYEPLASWRANSRDDHRWLDG